MQLRAIAITFPDIIDIILIGPSAMDIDTKVREQLDNFNIFPGHRHNAAQGEGGTGSLNLCL